MSRDISLVFAEDKEWLCKRCSYDQNIEVPQWFREIQVIKKNCDKYNINFNDIYNSRVEEIKIKREKILSVAVEEASK